MGPGWLSSLPATLQSSVAAPANADIVLADAQRCSPARQQAVSHAASGPHKTMMPAGYDIAAYREGFPVKFHTANCWTADDSEIQKR